MNTVELVARVLAASRTGEADKWSECCADALLVLAVCGARAALPEEAGGIRAASSVANDP
jgi:hypothetical protein